MVAGTSDSPMISHQGIDSGGATFITLPANTGNSVCFWGTVNGYPYMPELLQPQVAMLRQEDLEFLFGSLAAKERAD